MDRRNFLKFTSMSSVGITTEQWWSKDVGEIAEGRLSDKPSDVKIDPIVPIRFYNNRKDKMLQQLLELKKNYGLRRFLLCAPMDEVILTGFPKAEVYQQIGETILEVKQAQQSFEDASYTLTNLSFAAKSSEVELKRLANQIKF